MKKTLAAYLAIGLLAFAPILTAWFVADDWDFLILVAQAKSPAICFVALVGRFVRPLVMATYYANYHLFGLRPVPYHLTLVLVHIVNAWLVYLLALRLRLSNLAAFGAGLIFLIFSGHTEAVSWVAGAADPWLILLLIPALLLFDRALAAERPAPYIAGACVMLAACVLAKETAVTGPALLLLYGGSRLLEPLASDVRGRIVRRTLVTGAITAIVAIAYLAVRARIFGTVFGAYAQLGSSRGMMLTEARAFALRAFLPPGWKLAGLWLRHYDLILFAFAAVFLIALFVRRPDTRRGLAFLVPAFIVALAPALPLSISLVNSVSERYVYVATVFSAVLVAWIAELGSAGSSGSSGSTGSGSTGSGSAGSGVRRWFAIVAILAFVGMHVRALERSNHLWVAAGDLGRTVTSELIDRVRTAAPSTRTLVLDVPDTAAGVFVVRGAFYNSFHLMAPDVRSPESRIGMIASVAMASVDDVVRVEQTGPRSFTIALDRGVFLEQGGAATADSMFDYWSERGYGITFKPAPHEVQVLYTSAGHVRTAAILPGVPIGSLDIPADGTACTGDSLRFGGWALDEDSGVAVNIERVADVQASLLGTVTWRTGTRPDVTNAYRDLPDADRAEWNYLLPCAVVRSAGGRLDVRAAAVDRRGRRTELGTRTVVAK
jgi:hypothetical protein